MSSKKPKRVVKQKMETDSSSDEPEQKQTVTKVRDRVDTVRGGGVTFGPGFLVICTIFALLAGVFLAPTINRFMSKNDINTERYSRAEDDVNTERYSRAEDDAVHKRQGENRREEAPIDKIQDLEEDPLMEEDAVLMETEDEDEDDIIEDEPREPEMQSAADKMEKVSLDNIVIVGPIKVGGRDKTKRPKDEGNTKEKSSAKSDKNNRKDEGNTKEKSSAKSDKNNRKDEGNTKEKSSAKSDKKNRPLKTKDVPIKMADGQGGELPIRFVDNHDEEKRLPITFDEAAAMGENLDPPIADDKTLSNVTKGKKGELPDEIKNFKPTYLKEMKPKKIFADGRRIPPIELLHQKPNNSSVSVYMFEEFLSDAECDGLKSAHNRHLEELTKQDPILCFDSIQTLRQHLKDAKKKVEVTPQDFTTETMCVNSSFSKQLKTWMNGNWSYSTAFYPGESKFSKIFENRVHAATGLTQQNGGKFQITSYPEGIGYKTHTDCIEGGTDKRDRMGTILIYLETVAKGGETRFPELGIWVKPRKGRALVWNNMNKDGICEPLSVHTASKVEEGQKYILQRWYYHESFYSLGKRPPGPHLPARKEDQPRVSCDQYESGSCRWYDEWNYDHLLEYRRNTLTRI